VWETSLAVVVRRLGGPAMARQGGDLSVTADAPDTIEQPTTAPGPGAGLAQRDPGGSRPLRLLRTVDARTAPAVKWTLPSLVVTVASSWRATW
jgi:hypothetical protein